MKCYKQIDSFPLWNYIKVYETEDLRYLLILDDYDTIKEFEILEVYTKIWNDINNQCFEISQTQKSKNYISELHSLIKLRNDFNIITDSIVYLSLNVNYEIISILEKAIMRQGCIFKFDSTTHEHYFKSLEESQRLNEGLRSKIELKTLQFESKYKSNSTGKIDYYKIIASMNKHYGYRIDPKSITVREFLTMSMQMSEAINKDKNNKNGRRA